MKHSGAGISGGETLAKSRYRGHLSNKKYGPNFQLRNVMSDMSYINNRFAPDGSNTPTLCNATSSLFYYSTWDH